MVKKKGPAQKKRKGEASSTPADSKRQATGSSERTRSQILTPRTHNTPPFAAEDVDVAGAQKLAVFSASSEPDLAVTGVRAATPVFPAGVDTALEDYNLASSVIKSLLKGSVAKYERATEKVKNFANDKAKLAKELTSASVREDDLKKELAAARSELAAATEKAAKREEEVVAARAREVDIAATQGGVFNAFAERILYSKGFSALVSALTKPSKTRAVAEVLDQVAADFPTLDKGKYGYKPIDDDEMLRIYFRQLLKKASPFLVVGHLAERRALWSVDEVRDCQFDRDVEFEALRGPFRAELEMCPLSPDVSSGDEEEGEEMETERDADGRAGAGDAEVEETAEVRPPTTEVEPSGGVS